MTLKTKENYLKSMYVLEVEEGEISLSRLGKRMGVSLPTVNSMVKRLQDEGWVRYEKYKPLQLTTIGKKTAGLIIRKHRIVEMFLVKKLGFGWEEVHEIAEEMEHIHSDVLFERMDEMLGHPTMDPHGSPIPDKKSGLLMLQNKLKLSDVSIRCKVRLSGIIHTSTDFLLYLNKKDLQLGTEMEVIHIEPFDKSITISYNKCASLTLSKDVCERLYVEMIGEPQIPDSDKPQE
ncbi:MAG: metal-dependent transcriptional regulator [Prolixibacteraceae bacterium]